MPRHFILFSAFMDEAIARQIRNKIIFFIFILFFLCFTLQMYIAIRHRQCEFRRIAYLFRRKTKQNHRYVKEKT